ncbi:hypothetical protein [Streptomyces sp. NPDC056983]|uniref:hypothetical protein n=1 Tax=Streptomyces sp. NPDC056983 TaxID=3345987 RepID=UPI003636189D
MFDFAMAMLPGCDRSTAQNRALERLRSVRCLPPSLNLARRSSWTFADEIDWAESSAGTDIPPELAG